jgi:hypothetical protein
MKLRLDESLAALINDPQSVKALASTGKDGEVHLVFKGSISVNGDGDIEYLELIETSQTNKNLVHSLWFDRPVAITVLARDQTSWQIKGVPRKALVSGKEFQKNYTALREKLGKEADLSTVWIIEPREAREQSYPARREQEERKYPLIGHLDRFTRPGGEQS